MCFNIVLSSKAQKKFKMKLTQEATDKIAISLSMICAIHCLFLPTFLVLISSFYSIQLNNELIHLWILLIVIPFSFLGLTSGLRNHKKYSFFYLGVIAIVILILALLLSGVILGEFEEKLFTLIGSMMLATAHYKNYQICRKLNCSCHSVFAKNSKSN